MRCLRLFQRTKIAKKYISFRIPYHNDERAEAKRRKRWVDFIKLTQDKWTPSAHSAVCSEHFTPESIRKRFVNFPGQSQRLVRDDLGITAFPTINKLRRPGKPPLSAHISQVTIGRHET